jgi:hypothetical protein
MRKFAMRLEVARVKLFEYDYEELADQIQHGLERITVNFLRAHGARINKDLVDFHGNEQIDLELSYDGSSLKVHQVGRPRGPGLEASAQPLAGSVEEFESLFNGWPAADVSRDLIHRWLASLPAGEAVLEAERPAADPANPFAREAPRRPAPIPAPAPADNPFLRESPRESGSNPFAPDDRDRKRKDALRWLGDDD